MDYVNISIENLLKCLYVAVVEFSVLKRMIVCCTMNITALLAIIQLNIVIQKQINLTTPFYYKKS